MSSKFYFQKDEIKDLAKTVFQTRYSLNGVSVIK